MEVADGEAESRIDLKPTVGGDHDDARGFEGIVFGEDQLAMVVATYTVHTRKVRGQTWA